ncbi:xanthine dehydrogenase family protein molybdopterin-binding subunit [Ancylobacter sp. MQZ15Z-1]|uniref:Xanthine dehydrogenase family protein molybdopterin-binding subunit n=1 Tax=Ancylobacter mangrovi TaxID=2972472 RepID=A0A9X2T3E4_9HYPH|nr:xanthine dehydrogenase family protein molybdopterin-binding subunit [Ancylobacter mangrovi]MCS0497255.1 xanthine dehydrogenase family protein molybdopterin-binding subunit [Ancylobacter mangrovi]
MTGTPASQPRVVTRPSVGRPVPRLEDLPLLTGAGRYLDDIELPELLHCAFVRSPVAHARIERIDVEAARAMDGVHAVLTLADLMPKLTSGRMPLGASPIKGENSSTPFVLADREVAYVGEPIVLVVAHSRYLAEDAAAQVQVDFTPLPVASDARAAMAPDSPLVRTELKSNVLNSFKVGFGDVEAAFAGAAHVFSDVLSQHRGCGHSMEGRGVLAEIRPGDELCVWSSTQMPHDLYYMLQTMLGLDQDALRVVTPDVGGGFGPKYCLYPEEVALPAAARLLRRSLKWVEDRRETFISSIQERDQYWSVEVAVDAEARLLGIRGSLVHDQGAYAPKPVNLPYNGATAMSGPYILPAYSMDVHVVHTNKVPVSSVRGAGYPQAVFAMERTMDLIAAGMGLDRAEVRRRNLIPPEQMPYTKKLKARSGAAMVYDSGDYPASQREALAAAGWDDFPERQKRALAEGRYIGIGMANAVKGTGRGPFESGVVRVGQNGKVSIFTGAAAMGQGLATALAQICADQLAVPPEDVTVISGDTSKTPLGLGGFASRQLVTAGSSVHLAARAVAEKAIRAASSILEVDEDQLELREGHVHVRDGNRSLGLGEIARMLRGAPGYAFPAGVDPGLEASAQWRTDSLAYANACHVVEVEVEPTLGSVEITRYVALNDSGRMINPMIVEGQVQGGIVHGIGNALYEFMGYDDSCQPVTTTFQEYLLVTATELPRLETIFRETPSPKNPIGAKGVGETGTIPAAAAVISAVENALAPFGIRISQTPVPPQSLFRLIEAARQSQAGQPPRRKDLPDDQET